MKDSKGNVVPKPGNADAFSLQGFAIPGADNIPDLSDDHFKIVSAHIREFVKEFDQMPEYRDALDT